MPRDSHRSMYDGDDRVRLPVHIVILMVAVMVLFVGGGAGLVYFSITNHTAPSRTPPLLRYTPPQVPRLTRVLQFKLPLLPRVVPQ
jgi:hypothetical protein